MADDLEQLVAEDYQAPDPIYLSSSVAGPSCEPYDDGFESSIHDAITPTSLPLYHSHTFLIGIIGLLIGLFTAVAGIFEMFIFPLICFNSTFSVQWPVLDNFYGFAFYTGVVQVCNGATGIRVTITNRRRTVHRLFAIHLLSTLMYTISTIIVIISFSWGLSYHTTRCELVGHSLSASLICLGIVWQVFTLLFSYETIFDGRTTTVLQFILVSLINKISPPVPLDFSMETRGAASPPSSASPSSDVTGRLSQADLSIGHAS